MSDDPFAPPSQASRYAAAAPSRVQTSLFGALRRDYAASGRVAWMLVRLGQPEHRDHAASREAIEARDVAELRKLSAAVQATHDSSRADDAWRALCAAILSGLAEIMPAQPLSAEDEAELQKRFRAMVKGKKAANPSG